MGWRKGRKEESPEMNAESRVEEEEGRKLGV